MENLNQKRNTVKSVCSNCGKELLLQSKDANNASTSLCRSCSAKITITNNRKIDKWNEKNQKFVNETFDEITISRIYSLKNKSNKSITYIDGTCSCGNEVIKIVFGNLKSGNTKSCGKC